MQPHWTHIYEPDKDFVKDLHGIDPHLNVYWDAVFHDWIIVRSGVMNSYEIGHYKTLDNRVLASLYEGDLWRRRSPKDYEEYIGSYNDKLERDRKNYVHEANMEVARRAYVDRGIRENKTQF